MERLRIYTNKDCIQFVSDMKNAGLERELQHYKDKIFYESRRVLTGDKTILELQCKIIYEGPAIIVGNIQEVLSNTKVKCQWDNMGFDYIVYPVAKDTGRD